MTESEGVLEAGIPGRARLLPSRMRVVGHVAASGSPGGSPSQGHRMRHAPEAIGQAPWTMVNREQGQKTMVNGLKSQQNTAEGTWRVFRIVRAAGLTRADARAG